MAPSKAHKNSVEQGLKQRLWTAVYQGSFRPRNVQNESKTPAVTFHKDNQESKTLHSQLLVYAQLRWRILGLISQLNHVHKTAAQGKSFDHQGYYKESDEEKWAGAIQTSVTALLASVDPARGNMSQSHHTRQLPPPEDDYGDYLNCSWCYFSIVFAAWRVSNYINSTYCNRNCACLKCSKLEKLATIL